MKYLDCVGVSAGLFLALLPTSLPSGNNFQAVEAGISDVITAAIQVQCDGAKLLA